MFARAAAFRADFKKGARALDGVTATSAAAT
jgi:hypothetical protein